MKNLPIIIFYFIVFGCILTSSTWVPKQTTPAITIGYADVAGVASNTIIGYLPTNGGAMNGAIDLNYNNLININHMYLTNKISGDVPHRLYLQTNATGHTALQFMTEENVFMHFVTSGVGKQIGMFMTLDMHTSNIINLGTPVAASDAANKSYVDAATNAITPGGSSSLQSNQAGVTLRGNAIVGDKQTSLMFALSGTLRKVYIDSDATNTGADLYVDIRKNGSSLFTNTNAMPRILDGGYQGSTTILSNTAIAPLDRFYFDVKQVGSTVAGGNDLRIVLLYTVP